MEKLYDHEAAERLEEEKRLSEKKKSKKKRKKKAKKVSRYVLESDSESDREFLDDRRGKESSSGESDVQSADEEDALDEMYGPQSKHGKRRELERKKKQLEADAKKRRRNRGEEAISFDFSKPVLEKKKDVKKFKVPTGDELDKGEVETSLSFGFGLVDSDVYISKDEPKDDVVKTIEETKTQLTSPSPHQINQNF